jgi:hypothetical protein
MPETQPATSISGVFSSRRGSAKYAFGLNSRSFNEPGESGERAAGVSFVLMKESAMGGYRGPAA